MRQSVCVLVGWLALAGTAWAGNPTLEYRFKAADGTEFKWRDGKVEKLDHQPFMVTSDFGKRCRHQVNEPQQPRRV